MFYNEIKNDIQSSELVLQANSIFKSHKSGTLFCRLNTTTKSLVVAALYDLIKQKNNRFIILVTVNDNKAEEFAEDLSLLSGSENISLLPDFEILPYEERSPHISIRAQRLECLSSLQEGKSKILILSIRNLLRKIINHKQLRSNIITVGKGSEFEIPQFCSRLVSVGYEAESMVTNIGQYSLRGGIIDVFSPGSKYPVRIEFFGDTVDSVRSFDPATQRSTSMIEEEIRILPAREAFLENISTVDPILWDKIHKDGIYEGIEQNVSQLYSETSTIIDYLGAENTVTFIDEPKRCFELADELFEETIRLYEKKLSEIKNKKNVIAPPLPSLLFANLKDTISDIKKGGYYLLSSSYIEQKQIDLGAGTEDKNLLTIYDNIESDINPQTSLNSNLNLLKEMLDTQLEDKWKIYIQSDNAGQSRRMKELLPEYGKQINFTLGVLHHGFLIPDCRIAVYTDHEIFNRYKRKQYQEYFTPGETIIDYEALNPGDYLVHIEHGIGLFEGLKLVSVNDGNIECLVVKYANDVRVYIPTYQLRLVTKFVSEEGIIPEIHKIGGKRWKLTKNKAKKSIELIADDLVELYAERSMRQGISFIDDSVWQAEMEDSFIYEDTPDQKRATEEIKQDMESDKPMERLLCGDVGFGKTEVAIRAAFKAVLSGWQVAVIVPTTLLAEQHYNVFRERLAQYPVNIAMFSRFRTPKNIADDLVRLSIGKIDIAIGTHRLLSKDIKFHKIGLLIIDEEHRFGVKHKEKIRKMKSNIDTLYMSATPIPRTLNMALARLKELSLMQSSPKARLPIRTVIIPFNNEVIKDAIQREMDRGGQVFFVHNRVETIQSIADDLRQLVPNARIAVGHGQLPEKMLEKVMLDFNEFKFDVLVATTIIESGIDIPNANTLIVNRADMFGLAQLYQIRGRVGRSNRRAYAYFIVPKHLSNIAHKRLETLTEYNALGSGYQVAMRDLELRGAGSLLGTQQKGVINSVGFNYYNRLLTEAVNNITNLGKQNIWNDETNQLRDKVRVNADYFFPESYIKDEKIRLDVYKRMLEFENSEQFEDLKEELTDRFGELQTPAKRGIAIYKLRLLADKCGLESFHTTGKRIIIDFNTERIPSHNKIYQIVNLSKHPVEFDTSSGRFRMTINLKDSDIDNTISLAEKMLLKIQSWEV